MAVLLLASVSGGGLRKAWRWRSTEASSAMRPADGSCTTVDCCTVSISALPLPLPVLLLLLLRLLAAVLVAGCLGCVCIAGALSRSRVVAGGRLLRAAVLVRVDQRCSFVRRLVRAVVDQRYARSEWRPAAAARCCWLLLAGVCV